MNTLDQIRSYLARRGRHTFGVIYKCKHISVVRQIQRCKYITHTIGTMISGSYKFCRSQTHNSFPYLLTSSPVEKGPLPLFVHQSCNPQHASHINQNHASYFFGSKLQSTIDLEFYLAPRLRLPLTLRLVANSARTMWGANFPVGLFDQCRKRASTFGK